MRGAVIARQVGVLLFALELAPRLAFACSPAIPPPVSVNPALVGSDGAPPVLESVRLDGLERGVYDGCLVHTSFLLVADAWDDRTPSEQLGYRVELLRGEGPQVYDEPMAYMHFLWADDGARPLDVEMRVRAVDGAGNESNPIDIRVTDDGDGSEGGCSLARASGGGVSAWLPLFVAAAWRLRRRRG